MSNISAKDVQALRKATGVGMMDCKRALEASDGDMEAAAQWLREKGLAKAVDRLDRENTQGAIAVAVDGNRAALVELKAETDFSAKASDFVAVVTELADLVLAKGEAAVEERKAEIENLNIVKKENIAVGTVARFEAADGNLLDTYLHRQDGRGVVGVMLEGSGVRPGAAPRDRAACRLRQAPLPPARRDPRGRHREGAGQPARDHEGRGQARGGLAEDRRRAGQRLDRRPDPPRAGRPRRQGDRRPAHRRRPHRPHGDRRDQGLSGCPTRTLLRPDPRDRRPTRWRGPAGRASCSSCPARRSPARPATASTGTSSSRSPARSSRSASTSASTWPSSSGAATSGGGGPARCRAWTAHRPTTWACSPRS